MNFRKVGPIILSLFISSFTLTAQGKELKIIPDPGAYSRDQAVKMVCEPGYKILYGFQNNSADPEIPYTEPFLLSALPGEEREYRITAVLLKDDLILERNEYTFLIDKKVPAPPYVNVPGGTYNQNQTVRLQAEPGTRTVYSTGGSAVTPLMVWHDEEIILEGRTGETRVYTLSAYSVDSAGNRSTVKNWIYTIEYPRKKTAALEILSPLEGSFGNPQLLYIRESGYSWIRYTLNGADPVLAGGNYTGPVMLRRTGNVVLKIAALPEGAREPENYEINYQVIANSPRLNVPESGVYSSSFSFHSAETDGRYCLEDRIPEYPDPELTGEVRILEIPRGIREIPFRALLNQENGNLQYRYFYVLDNRFPADPLIKSTNRPPLSGNTKITIDGSDFSFIHYTLDGTTPDLNSPRYTSPFNLILPEEPGSGSLIVKARAFAKNGFISAETSSLFTYNRSRPAKPDIQVLQESTGSEALIVPGITNQGTTVLYNISTERQISDLQITRNSPVFPDKAILDVPRGQENTFYLVFAAMDAAGNISETTDLLEIRINRRSILEPLLEYQKGLVTLWGTGSLLYRIDEVNRAQTTAVQPGNNATGAVRTYTEPFRLPGEWQNKEIVITAWSEDSAGNKSSEAKIDISIPLTIPEPPQYSGISSGDILNRKSVIIYLNTVPEGNDIHYVFVTGMASLPEITADSPLARETLSLFGTANETTAYRLGLRTRNRASGKFSSLVEIDFILDLKPPVLPVLLGIQDEKTYRGSVTMTLPEGFSDQVYISYTLNGEAPPDPFGDGGFRLFNSRTFSVPSGEEGKILYRIGVQDSAGNRTRDDNLHWVILDNRIPVLPELTGFPDKGFSPGPVIINRPLNSDGVEIHYELTTDGTFPGLVDINSPQVSTDGLLIAGLPGENTTVFMRYKAKSSMGVWSREEKLLSFVLDRTPPPSPGEPGVQIMEGEQQLVLSWEVPAAMDLYFRIPELNRDFLLYNEPVSFSFPSGSQVATVEAYLADAAGNRSPQVQSSLFLPVRFSQDLVKGYPENGLSNSLVRLYKIQNSEQLRYEIGTGGNYPGPVNQFSPVFPKNMDLDAGTGESVDYILRVRNFNKELSIITGNEQIIQFTIDRHKPVPPEIIGIEDREHYQEDLLLSFRDSSEEIYFMVQKGALTDNPDIRRYQKYSRPFTIKSEEGTFDNYRVFAYHKNKAGNQSEIREWNFTIDREIIYVSPGGNDLYSGTRSRPFLTLEKAIAYSSATGRKTIFLSQGSYNIDDSLVISGEMNIVGGLDKDSWTPAKDAKSLITAGEYFPPGRSIFLAAGNGQISGVVLEIYQGRADSAFRLEGGNWSITDSEISLRGAYPAQGILVTGGKLTFEKSVMTGEQYSGQALMVSGGGEILVKKSLLERRNNTGSSLLISILPGGNVRIEGSELTPGSGRSTKAVSVNGGTLWVGEQSLVDCGSGSVDAQGIYSKDGDITVLDSKIHGRNSSRIIQGIYGENSEILIQDSDINIEASAGAVAFQARNSRYLVLGNTIFASGQEFIYLVRLENSTGKAFNNYLSSGVTQDFKGISLDKCVSGWYQNTMLFKPGSRSHFGFTARQSEDLNIINNILVSDGPGFSGIAVQAETGNIRIQGNNFYGWKTIYENTAGGKADTADSLNLMDKNPQGGSYHRNIEESPAASFIDPSLSTPKLKSTSACVNAGMDLSLNREMALDWEKQKRPNPGSGVRPAYDIGADEYYP